MSLLQSHGKYHQAAGAKRTVATTDKRKADNQAQQPAVLVKQELYFDIGSAAAHAFLTERRCFAC